MDATIVMTLVLWQCKLQLCAALSGGSFQRTE